MIYWRETSVHPQLSHSCHALDGHSECHIACHTSIVLYTCHACSILSCYLQHFYKQNEMLDMHGGLENLPLALIDDSDHEVVMADAKTYEVQISQEKFDSAKKLGKIINLAVGDSEMKPTASTEAKNP